MVFLLLSVNLNAWLHIIIVILWLHNLAMQNNLTEDADATSLNIVQISRRNCT